MFTREWWRTPCNPEVELLVGGRANLAAISLSVVEFTSPVQPTNQPTVYLHGKDINMGIKYYNLL